MTEKIGLNFVRKPIALRKQKFSQSKMFVAGWGGAFPNYEPSDLLKKIGVINPEEWMCNRYYRKFGFNDETQQCGLTKSPSTQYVTMVIYNTFFLFIKIVSLSFTFIIYK